jgi:hypothetical protein
MWVGLHVGPSEITAATPGEAVISTAPASARPKAVKQKLTGSLLCEWSQQDPCWGRRTAKATGQEGTGMKGDGAKCRRGRYVG